MGATIINIGTLFKKFLGEESNGKYRLSDNNMQKRDVKKQVAKS